jgi:hypothetical protein
MNATTTSLTLVQTLAIPTSSTPTGVTFVNESIAIVVARGGGIQKYALTSTAIIFVTTLLSQSGFNTLTFFPGSKSQGYISDYSNYNLYVF